MEIKETKEVLKAFIKLAAVLAENFKDGVQATDVAPILAKLQDPAIQALIKEAYNGIDQVPAEAKDLTLEESLDLMVSIAPEVIDLVKAIKK